ARVGRARAAVDAVGERPAQAAPTPPIEHDRHALALHLARIEPLDRALARCTTDFLRGIEIGAVDRGGIVIIALHRGALTGDCAHRYALAGTEIGAGKTVAGENRPPAHARR